MTDDEVIRYAMVEKERAADEQVAEDDRRISAASAATKANALAQADVTSRRRDPADNEVRLYVAIGILAAILLACALFSWFQRQDTVSSATINVAETPAKSALRNEVQQRPLTRPSGSSRRSNRADG